jgi:thymidylate synthase
MAGEQGYLDLLKKVLDCGELRKDRTGTGTLSLFAPDPLRFNISESVPLYTTKKVPKKPILEELLWFLRGDTDAKILQEKGVHIWDGNSSKKFLRDRGLSYSEGVCGPLYGFQWRHFGAPYDEMYADSRVPMPENVDPGYDQIGAIENLLKNDPFSRRIYLNAWNAKDLDKMSLTPCFPEGTLVLTKDGYKEIQDVVLTDQLYTHKGQWKDIENIQIKRYTGPLRKLFLSGFPEPIICTPEHPFLTRSLTKTESSTNWVEACDLTREHVLLLPIRKTSIVPQITIVHNSSSSSSPPSLETYSIDEDDEFFLMGYIYGNHYFCTDLELDYNMDLDIPTCTVSFYLEKTGNYHTIEYLERLRKVLDFERNSSYRSEYYPEIALYECVSEKWSGILFEFEEQTSSGTQKKIPEWLQDAPVEKLLHFVEGYFASDGTFNRTKSSGELYNLQRIFAKCDMKEIPRKRKREGSPYRGDENNWKNENIDHIENIEDFEDIENIEDLENIEDIENIEDNEDNMLYHILERIETIHVSEKAVYNFQVSDDHSYTVQNVAVHNCHVAAQFYVSVDLKGDKHLSCHVYIRSNDLFLGNPFNVFSYAVLTYILAMRCDMKPRELVVSFGDAHIYLNHIDQVREQISRTPLRFPQLVISDAVKELDYSEMTADHFEVVGYKSHPAIKGAMSA